MPIEFPSEAWLQAFQDRLNASAAYASVAHKWEGDILFVVERAGQPPARLYLDLWHGKCRGTALLKDDEPDRPAAFRLIAPLPNFVQVLRGQLDPMQAMMTGKLKVQGNMVVMMKNIPTVLEFVRTGQQIETTFAGEA